MVDGGCSRSYGNKALVFRHCSRHQGKKKHEWERLCQARLSRFPFLPNVCHKRTIFLAKTINNKSVYLFSDGETFI